MKNVMVEKEKILFEVDYRLELLGIIEALIYNKEKIEHFGLDEDGEYYKQIIERFGCYKNHPVVLKLKDLMEKHGFYFDAPVNMFLQLDENFSCDNLNDYVLNKRLDGNNEIYNFIEMLKPFSDEIGYDTFYNNNKLLYSELLNTFSDEISHYNVMKFLETYTGVSFDKQQAHVPLMPLIKKHNYGIHHDTDVYACIGLRAKYKNIDSFKKVRFVYAKLVLHEFLHSVINPITDKLQLIKEDDETFSEIKEVMKKQAYGNNECIINEHIIRAITMRYVDMHFSKDDYDRSVEQELNQQFIYLPNIINSLIEYENHHDEYKTIADFYPAIIDNIKQEKNHQR